MGVIGSGDHRSPRTWCLRAVAACFQPQSSYLLSAFKFLLSSARGFHRARRLSTGKGWRTVAADCIRHAIQKNPPLLPKIAKLPCP